MPTMDKYWIDPKEYGAMCQKINDIEERLEKFVGNEFRHLSAKVDRMLFVVITALVGLIANLVILILK